MRTLRSIFLLCLSLAGCAVPGHSYSVLTHEQVIDLVWKDQIQPMLLKRFPQATPDDLKHAHAFAYGGSLIQDMGYYPFGKKYFSDLVHYVRSGDFVTALLHESSDINEYAFALGALAHYSSDNVGHPTINQVVAIEFPKLRAKHGNAVTYADDPKAHIRTEFGFDMVQVAKNRYTSDRYHDFIGFEVSKPVLERAFLSTYGIKLSDVMDDEDKAIGSFRRSVSTFIPEITRVALLNRKKELVRDTPNFNQKQFLYHLSRANYEKEWGKGYRKPGFGARVLAFFLRIIPKIGPAKALAFKIPTTQGEDMYIKSVDKTVENYNSLLRQVRQGDVKFPDTDFDTGRATKAGEYSLADETYQRLLKELTENKFAQLTPELKANILRFYSNPIAPLHTKKKEKTGEELQRDLEQLKAQPETQEPETQEPQPQTSPK
ncbi:MAG TPA: zinc dependent phospholipase C family protein [Terriglobales bacterium]